MMRVREHCRFQRLDPGCWPVKSCRSCLQCRLRTMTSFTPGGPRWSGADHSDDSAADGVLDAFLGEAVLGGACQLLLLRAQITARGGVFFALLEEGGLGCTGQLLLGRGGRAGEILRPGGMGQKHQHRCGEQGGLEHGCFVGWG